MSRQTDQLRRARDILDGITAYDLVTSLGRIHDWLPGISGGGDGPGPKNSVSDPVGNSAGQPDPASDQLRRINHALDRLVLHAEHLAAELAASRPRTPSTKDIEATKYANDRLCEHCTRWSDGNGDRAHVDGKCRWCYDFDRRVGRLPNEAEATRHHRGQRVMVRP